MIVRRRRGLLTTAAMIVASVTLAWVGLTVAAGLIVRTDAACVSCHAMDPYRASHQASSHGSVGCVSCHGATGAAAPLFDGLALERRVTSQALGTNPTVARIDDDGCRGCHADQLAQTIATDGVRVRHADFLATECAECHGGVAHALEQRAYLAPEMDSCIGCHKVAANELGTCEMCHSSEDAKVRAASNTTWRTTHGPGWRETHGMGDLKSCGSCHAPSFCVDCHGTPLPHASTWAVEHGRGLTAADRRACEVCHQASWCDSCHGIPMPHAAGFMSAHPAAARSEGAETCSTCHATASCDACHERARHRQAAEAGSPHKVGD